MARHFFLATRPSDATRRIDYARRAGESALEALAPDDAVRYFTQAHDLAAQSDGVDPGVRIDVLIGLGTAQRQSGIASFRETLLEAARIAQGLGDTDRLVAAALANSRGWFSAFGQVDGERIDVLEAALDALADSDSPERALLLATLCSEVTYHSPLERRLALADEAKAVARRLGDRATFADIVRRCGAALFAPSTLSNELADVAEALSAAADLDDPSILLQIGFYGATLAVGAGEFELARARLAIVQAAAEKLRQPSFLWLAALADAAFAVVEGDTEKAERLATAASRGRHGRRRARRLRLLRYPAHDHPRRTRPVGGVGVAHLRIC